MNATKQLTVNQVGNMLIFMASGIKLISYPSIAYGLVGRDSWILILFLTIVDTLALILILQLSKLDPDLTFFQFLSKVLGKYVAKLIFLLLAFIVFIKLMLMFQEMKSFFIETLYRDFSCPFFLVPICFLMVYSASVGIRAIARSVGITIIFAVISGAIVMFYGIQNVDVLNIFPVLENGLSNWWYGIFKSTYAFGDVALILLFLGNIKIEKGYEKKIIGKWIFGSVLMLAAVFLFYNTFDVISGVYQFAVSDVSKVDYRRINTGGLNSVITVGLTFGMFTYTSILFYCCYKSIGKVINFKNKYFIIIPLISLLICVLFITHFNMIEGRNLIVPWMRFLSLFFEFGLPFLIPPLIWIYKKKKRRFIL